MSLALFKLESFSSPTAIRPPEPTFSRDDLDQAFADGMARARAEAADAQAAALRDELARLAASLSDDADRRRVLRQEAVEALTPVLHQILDLTAPAFASRRLEEALRDELADLARRAAAPTARIACPEPLHPLVASCIADAGLEGIELIPAADDRITITLQGGRIEFDPARTVAEIRALILEITEDTNPWTH